MARPGLRFSSPCHNIALVLCALLTWRNVNLNPFYLSPWIINGGSHCPWGETDQFGGRKKRAMWHCNVSGRGASLSQRSSFSTCRPFRAKGCSVSSKVPYIWSLLAAERANPARIMLTFKCSSEPERKAECFALRRDNSHYVRWRGLSLRNTI